MRLELMAQIDMLKIRFIVFKELIKEQNDTDESRYMEIEEKILREVNPNTL